MKVSSRVVTCVPVRSSGSPVPAVALPLILAVAILASFAFVTTPAAMVRATDPVTSPLWVALVTFAVFSATAALFPTSVSKSEMVAAACVPVWFARAKASASIAVGSYTSAVMATPPDSTAVFSGLGIDSKTKSVSTNTAIPDC